MKKNNNGFTLIELLVVVAIIGILAAVGVVAYNGYTSGAKKSAAQAQHKTIVKFIQSEILKCSIGQEIILKKISSNTIVDQPDLCPKVTNINSGNNSYDVISAFDYHFKAIDLRNVYYPQWFATSTCSVSGSTVYNNNGQGGGTCITRQLNNEIIVGTNITPTQSLITKFNVD